MDTVKPAHHCGHHRRARLRTGVICNQGYAQPKYACGRCQQGVVQAALTARPIEKGRPGAALLQVVSSKYTDHLPLDRLEQLVR